MVEMACEGGEWRRGSGAGACPGHDISPPARRPDMVIANGKIIQNYLFYAMLLYIKYKYITYYCTGTLMIIYKLFAWIFCNKQLQNVSLFLHNVVM